MARPTLKAQDAANFVHTAIIAALRELDGPEQMYVVRRTLTGLTRFKVKIDSTPGKSPAPRERKP